MQYETYQHQDGWQLYNQGKGDPQAKEISIWRLELEGKKCSCGGFGCLSLILKFSAIVTRLYLIIYKHEWRKITIVGVLKVPEGLH